MYKRVQARLSVWYDRRIYRSVVASGHDVRNVICVTKCLSAGDVSGRIHPHCTGVVEDMIGKRDAANRCRPGYTRVTGNFPKRQHLVEWNADIPVSTVYPDTVADHFLLRVFVFRHNKVPVIATPFSGRQWKRLKRISLARQ